MLAPKELGRAESEPGKDPVLSCDPIPTIVSMPRLWSLVAGRARHAPFILRQAQMPGKKKTDYGSQPAVVSRQMKLRLIWAKTPRIEIK